LLCSEKQKKNIWLTEGKINRDLVLLKTVGERGKGTIREEISKKFIPSFASHFILAVLLTDKVY